MPLVMIRQVAPGIAYIHPLEGPVDPGFGTGGGFPDNSLPGGGFDHIWGGVGGRPGRPDNSLPGSPGHPDNRPPSGRPPQVGPGEVLVLVRDQAGVWHYAALPSGSPPPKPVPVPPPTRPDNTLPPAPEPKK